MGGVVFLEFVQDKIENLNLELTITLKQFSLKLRIRHIYINLVRVPKWLIVVLKATRKLEKVSGKDQQRIPAERKPKREATTKAKSIHKRATEPTETQRTTQQRNEGPRDPKCRKQAHINIESQTGVGVACGKDTNQRSKPVLGRARQALLSQKRTLQTEELAALEKKKYRRGLSIKAAVLL